MDQSFVDVVGVDALHGPHQGTVQLGRTVEQEAVFFTGTFLAVEHDHVTFGTRLHFLGAAGEHAVSLQPHHPGVHGHAALVERQADVDDGRLMLP